MDITDLEKKLGIEGMSADEQMAMVVALQKSAQEKALKARDETLGKSAELVVQGLKRIKTDIETRFEQLNSTIQNKVSSIQDGKDGRDGKNGLDGKQGLQGLNGKDGRDGRDGVDGVDGVSVTSAHIDFDGSLVIGLSSGVELNVGEVVAPDLAESIKVITNGGGTSQSVLDTLDSLQTQINNLIPSQTGNSGKYLTTNGTALSWATVSGGGGGGGLSYQGTWNASTNSPTLASSTGTNGYYYIVSTAGSTNLNGITDWQVGDWLMFNGSVWQKIDQTNSVTSVNSKTGAVVLNNVDISGFTSIAAAGTTTTLTSSSAPNYVVTGSGGQTIQLPDATTLVNGALFSFNNNQSSGTIVVKNNSSTTIATIQSGGYISIVLLSNSIAAGSWDVHNYAPSNVSWSTNTFDYPGSITSATWNGNVVTYNRGGTGQSSAFVAGGIVYGSTTSALAVTSAGTSGQVLTSGGTGAPTWSNPATGTVTSVTGTSPVVSSGGNTPAISLASGYGDTQNPYASKTANYVLAAPNGSAGAPTFRAIVAADIPTLNQNTTGTAADITASSNSSLTTLSSLSLPGSQVSGNISGNSANVTGTVAIANGGTGQTTKAAGYDALNPNTTLGDIAYRGASNNVSLAGNTTTTKKFLAQTGTGTVSAAPAWATIVAGDVPTLNQDTTGSAGSLVTTNFSIVQSGTKLLFKYGATTIASMDSTGIITSATNIVANGTP